MTTQIYSLAEIVQKKLQLLSRRDVDVFVEIKKNNSVVLLVAIDGTISLEASMFLLARDVTSLLEDEPLLNHCLRKILYKISN